MRIKQVPISEIDVGDRMRKEYKDVPALAESLKEKGFILENSGIKSMNA